MANKRLYVLVFEHYPQQCCSLLAPLSLYISLDNTIVIFLRNDISTKRLELCVQVINTVAQLKVPHCLLLEKEKQHILWPTVAVRRMQCHRVVRTNVLQIMFVHEDLCFFCLMDNSPRR